MSAAPPRSNQTNPLLARSPLPFGAVPFDRLDVSLYLPALTTAIAQTKQAVAAIAATAGPADFANTVAALEAATAPVYDVAIVYSNLKSAHGDAAMHALAKEIMPALARLESDLNLDAGLFARVKAAYERRAELGLDAEETTLLEKSFRSFRRNGALLSDADKAKLRALDAELSTLGPQFSENVLKATNAFELWITDAKDLAGLPPSTVEQAAQAAGAKGRPEAWLVTLHAPSMIPFLRYADARPLREQVWRAYHTRAQGGEGDNRQLVRRIARLRHQRARLLGYPSHAAFQLEERMAERPERVKAFIDRLLAKTRPAADRELDELRAYMQKQGAGHDLMPWDFAYWSNKLKEERFQVDAEATRPYFELGRTLEGAFEHARRLFDLDFAKTDRVPVYAPDVAVYEVKVRSTGEAMGLFYVDFFPRPTKAGGGWCTRFRQQAQGERPHVSIVCNFSPPTPGKPSLLTFQEVLTLFHEFGHALHGLLSRVKHRSLCCTNVYRDFVELPSQIMENWVKEKESLALFARHHETGELIPDALVRKVLDSENFQAAYQMMRQLRFGLLDLAWYDWSAAGDDGPAAAADVEAFELAAVAPADLLPNVPGTNVSCSFEHIFSGGYSAGYYGYKWAEVLDADAFELFKERGVFARDVADRFRTAVLERGGTEHPMVLYKRFRGREPDPDALLRRSQLI